MTHKLTLNPLAQPYRKLSAMVVGIPDISPLVNLDPPWPAKVYNHAVDIGFKPGVDAFDPHAQAYVALSYYPSERFYVAPRPGQSYDRPRIWHPVRLVERPEWMGFQPRLVHMAEWFDPVQLFCLSITIDDYSMTPRTIFE